MSLIEKVTMKASDQSSASTKSCSDAQNDLAHAVQNAQRRLEEGNASSKDFSAVATAYDRYIKEPKGMNCK